MQTVEYKIYSMSYKDMTYIGQTKVKYVSNRIAKHKYRMLHELDNHSKLYTALRKHGFDNFREKVLAVCHTQEDADMIEQRYIKAFGNLNTRHR